MDFTACFANVFGKGADFAHGEEGELGPVVIVPAGKIDEESLEPARLQCQTDMTDFEWPGGSFLDVRIVCITDDRWIWADRRSTRSMSRQRC